ncbi:MAG: rod shape-determining protein MreC [Bacteroidota bacterium]|nr:rod shape-determining protein MreC [Bacteroidota bacterium]
MQKLFQFFYQFRAFFFFVILEVASGYLIIKNNRFQNAAFFNSSNEIAGNVLGSTNEVKSYFSLKDINESLVAENALLRSRLANTLEVDTLGISFNDPSLKDQYHFLAAKVINNSTDRYNNYITIDKGSLQGVAPGMGIISPEGIVGKVKTVSLHYATVTSLLHSDGFVSSVIKKSGVFGSIKWEGKDARSASLKFVPRHIKVLEGDTITSSGFNSIYPGGIMIGLISEIDIKGNEAFYDIKVDLSTDFSKLGYVYVVQNTLKAERDSLEGTIVNK